ncbi:hypothetical protein FHR84_002799 [Actinopolyspora biskrensis]|uniref:Uncharacterized protein n=1 Tax=Actinopolyspora biskrensis TaxID=1470178 RepID=A0A852YXV4_9ACTN|nr:hypothetical protein [Actinopolyspora biskrensis]NYH79461.1 hypothetical protein [Actinopolyspora biskrensis]
MPRHPNPVRRGGTARLAAMLATLPALRWSTPAILLGWFFVGTSSAPPGMFPEATYGDWVVLSSLSPRTLALELVVFYALLLATMQSLARANGLHTHAQLVLGFRRWVASVVGSVVLTATAFLALWLLLLLYRSYQLGSGPQSVLLSAATVERLDPVIQPGIGFVLLALLLDWAALVLTGLLVAAIVNGVRNQRAAGLLIAGVLLAQVPLTSTDLGLRWVELADPFLVLTAYPVLYAQSALALTVKLSLNLLMWGGLCWWLLSRPPRNAALLSPGG